MNKQEYADRNYRELFPDGEPDLKATDPELAEILYNFAFGEVPQYGSLDTKTRMKVILASLIGMQTLSEFKIMMEGALNAGVTPVEIKEIIYQAVPYCGIAKVYDFIRLANEILTARGIKLPLEGQSTTTQESRFESGLAVQKSIFGEVIDSNYKNAPENQIHIQRYLSGNCFGDYYTRTGLDVQTRELLTFSILLSMGGCEPQLKGHIAGNVSVGNDKKILLSAVTQLIPYIGYPRTLNAVRCINEVIPEN